MKVCRICNVFILVIICKFSYSQQIGDHCNFKNSTFESSGSCKYVEDCRSVDYLNYPIQLSLQNRCTFENEKVLIVCCPESLTLGPRNGDREENSLTFCSPYNEEYIDLAKKYSHDNITDVRVIGGTISTRTFPFLGTLAYNTSDGGYKFQCGGALISRHHVLTAAHCIYNSLNFVRFGHVNNLIGNANEIGPNDYIVENKHLHPGYQKENVRDKYHDIAILTLSRIVEMSDKIWPACLNIAENAKHDRLKIAGFGITETGKQSEHLMEAGASELSNEKCKAIFRRGLGDNYLSHSGLSQGLLESQLCAMNETKFVDTCPGDSGTPLSYFDESNQLHRIVGITSFGFPCGRQHSYPGVYTRISSYLKWIENLVWPKQANSLETDN